MSRLVDGDLALRLSAAGTERLNLLDDIETVGNLAKDDVLAIEPRGSNSGDEKLRSVAIESWFVSRHWEHGGEVNVSPRHTCWHQR